MPPISKKRTIQLKIIGVFAIIIFLTMYVYGMANVYFPEPVSVGAGQYLDISSGVTVVGLFLVGLLLALFFRKEMKKISNLKRI